MGMSLGKPFQDLQPVLNAILHKYGNVNFQRFRKIYIDNKEDIDTCDQYVPKKVLTVVTRTGGGNREEYENDNQENHKHVLFIDDQDDEDDSTFCHFTFHIPIKYKYVVDFEEFLTKQERYMTKEEYKEFISKVGDTSEVRELLDKYVEEHQ